ncbi:MAG: response regulator [SAR324 cluster bacterium]|nr:response regulator [SAR324 cluster bacterium]
MKILIIDQGNTSRAFIRQELSSVANAEFLEAQNSEEGLAAILEHQPDLVTTNLVMADNDGISFAETIRSRTSIAHIPIIVITSSLNEELVKKAFAIGSVDFFMKPFKPGELLKLVEDLFLKAETLEGMNVLVADDSSVVREIISRVLHFKGINVFEANDGAQAIQILQTNSDIDLVITDYLMPHVNGMELCQHIRKIMKNNQLPIIILTTVGDQSTVNKGIKAGANDYLTKPFSRHELLARLYNHAQLIRYHNTLQQEIEERKRREIIMDRELEQARQTQKMLLPQKLPNLPHAQIFTKFIPLEQIGGDFYNIFELGNNQFGVLVADVTGHGVSAALISFMVYGILSETHKAGTSTEVVMNLTNGFLENKLQEGKFASLIYVIYDASNQILTYTTAGHPPGIVVRSATRETFLLKTTGLFAGLFPNDLTNYGEQQFQMLPGDRLFLYTDAIIESMNEKEEIIGTPDFASFLLEHGDMPIDTLLDRVYEYGIEFSNADYEDDFTLIGIEIDTA